MKKTITLFATALLCLHVGAQIDPQLLRKPQNDTGNLKMNMDAVYDRPFIKVGKLPVSLGGYVEANYQYLSENGISEGNQFQMRRLTLFIASSVTASSSLILLCEKRSNQALCVKL